MYKGVQEILYSRKEKVILSPARSPVYPCHTTCPSTVFNHTNVTHWFMPFRTSLCNTFGHSQQSVSPNLHMLF